MGVMCVTLSYIYMYIYIQQTARKSFFLPYNMLNMAFCSLVLQKEMTQKICN